MKIAADRQAIRNSEASSSRLRIQPSRIQSLIACAGPRTGASLRPLSRWWKVEMSICSARSRPSVSSATSWARPT
jgi:hypothetical protein